MICCCCCCCCCCCVPFASVRVKPVVHSEDLGQRLRSVKGKMVTMTPRRSEHAKRHCPYQKHAFFNSFYPSTLSLLTICSYVLRMLCASLYLIIALSSRFSSMRIFRVSGESSRFGFSFRKYRNSGQRRRSSHEGMIAFTFRICLRRNLKDK